MKKDWIKEAYRKWFSRLDEEAPEDVWTGIADELDVDEVWTKINSELDRVPRPWFWRWTGRVAAVLLLLISALAAYFYLSPAPADRKTPMAAQPTLSPPENKPQQPDANTSDLPSASPIDEVVHEEAPLQAAFRIPSETAEAVGHVPHERTAHTERTSQAVQAELPELPRPNAPADLLAGISVHEESKTVAADDSPFIQLKRLGVVSAYSNTWMLNHETFSGLQPSTLHATTFTYGSSVGINAGFLLKDKHKIGAELYLNAHSGQGYRQYIEARYQSRSIKLDYYKLQLYYQLPLFSGKSDILTGAYASYLKRGREEVAGEARAVGRFYRAIDYGIMTGYQFNLQVNERLLLQPGIRVSYGIPNIFNGNQHIPGNFLRTHNAAAGLYLGVSYRLY